MEGWCRSIYGVLLSTSSKFSDHRSDIALLWSGQSPVSIRLRASLCGRVCPSPNIVGWWTKFFEFLSSILAQSQNLHLVSLKFFAYLCTLKVPILVRVKSHIVILWGLFIQLQFPLAKVEKKWFLDHLGQVGRLGWKLGSRLFLMNTHSWAERTRRRLV